MIDYHDERPTRERPSLLLRARSLYAYAIVVLLILAGVAAALIWYTGNLDRELPAPQATAVTAPTAAATSPSSPATKPAAGATAAPNAPTLAPSTKVKVANTGGLGLNLRSEPGRSSATVASLADGTVLEVIGPEVQADGLGWKNVKDAGGQTGWVASEFLAPEP